MNINTAIITINQSGVIQSVDKGCCRMFGYEVSELQSQKINILIPTPYKEQHDSYLENYLRTSRPKACHT
jgi:PAS domain S-box-containing protein